MSNRRKPKSKGRGPTLSRQHVNAFGRSTAQALGQPVQTARPLVTEQLVYSIIPVFDGAQDNSHPDNPAPPGEPGTYIVTYCLAIPGRNVVQDRVDFAAQLVGGDSLLEVAPEVAEIRVDLWDDLGNTVVAKVDVNEHHRLRSITMQIEAASRANAFEQGHDLVAPLLSRWAYLHDVAITTSGTQVVEVASRAMSWGLTLLGAVKAFSDHAGTSSPEHRLLLSTYRDGISSLEPLYQALCFYKVAEGVWALRRERNAAARAVGQTPGEPSERVPADLTGAGHTTEAEVLRDALGPYVGKKFRNVFEDIRETLRNAIAHLDPDANPLAHDSWGDTQRVRKIVPGLRWMARRLLDAELST